MAATLTTMLIASRPSVSHGLYHGLYEIRCLLGTWRLIEVLRLVTVKT